MIKATNLLCLLPALVLDRQTRYLRQNICAIYGAEHHCEENASGKEELRT